MLSLDQHGVCTVDRMRTVTLPLPMFGFVVSTRAALAAGLGLFFADRLPAERRRILGLCLIAFGAATTIPAATWVSRSFRRSSMRDGVEREPRLIGATRFARKGDDIA
jgi:hypothetical protein